MGGVSPETCLASYKSEIKLWYTVASCWIFYVNYPQTRVIFQKLIFSRLLRNWPHSMKADGSLPRSQQPLSCTYPASDSSVHAFPFYLFKIHFNSSLPSKPRFPKFSLYFKLPNPNLYAILFNPNQPTYSAQVISDGFNHLGLICCNEYK